MENYKTEIVKAITEDVKSNAELVTKYVKEEAEDMVRDRLAFFKESLKKETDTYLEKELSDLQSYAASKSSKDKMETKKKLLLYRHSLSSELFADVRKDLEAFVKSDAYEAYLVRNLKKIEVSTSGIFYVKEADLALMQKVLQAHALFNNVSIGYFEIGGFLYRDEVAGLEYSCALDEKLSEQESWFYNNSGFKVTEREDEA